MILAHHEIEKSFVITPEIINVLVVEREEKFFEYCSQLSAQISGSEGAFCLSEEDTNICLSKSCAFVSDLFSFACNDKKVSTKLMQSLQEAVNSQYELEYAEIIAKACELFDKLNADSDYPIEYNTDEALQGLLKAFGIKLAEESGVLERVVAYIKVLATFLKIRCVFFMNLKTILSKPQLEQLYHEARLNEVNLFLLESTTREKLSSEVVTLIDPDLCEISL